MKGNRTRTSHGSCTVAYNRILSRLFEIFCMLLYSDRSYREWASFGGGITIREQVSKPTFMNMEDQSWVPTRFCIFSLD